MTLLQPALNDRSWRSTDVAEVIFHKWTPASQADNTSKFSTMWKTVQFSHLYCNINDAHHGTHRIFSRGGQLEGLKDENPPVGYRGRTPVGVWGNAGRSWQHFLKIMHKYYVHWDFRLQLQHKKNFTTFPRGRQVPSPLAHACGHPCCSVRP